MFALSTLIVFVLSVAFLAWLLVSLMREVRTLRAENDLLGKESYEISLKLELCKREIHTTCLDLNAEKNDVFPPFIKRLKHLENVIDPYRLGDWRKELDGFFKSPNDASKSTGGG